MFERIQIASNWLGVYHFRYLPILLWCFEFHVYCMSANIFVPAVTTQVIKQLIGCDSNGSTGLCLRSLLICRFIPVSSTLWETNIGPRFRSCGIKISRTFWCRQRWLTPFVPIYKVINSIVLTCTKAASSFQYTAITHPNNTLTPSCGTTRFSHTLISASTIVYTKPLTTSTVAILLHFLIAWCILSVRPSLSLIGA